MVSIASCLGCQQSDVFPVKGKVLIGGQPAGGTCIVFHPLDKRIVSRAVATTTSDGSFQLMTHRVGDGAPVGDHIVTLFQRDMSMPVDDCVDTELIKHDLLRGKYLFSHLSSLRATVRRRANDILIEAEAPADDPKKKPVANKHARAGGIMNGWGSDEE